MCFQQLYKRKDSWIWLAWILNLIFNIIFAALAFATFGSLKKVGYAPQSERSNPKSLEITCITSAILVILFNLLSFGVILKETFEGDGVGLMYGFTLGSCFFIALFIFDSSFQLNVADYMIRNFNIEYRGYWNNSDTILFRFTYAAGFVSFFWFMVLFIVMAFYIFKFGSREKFYKEKYQRQLGGGDLEEHLLEGESSQREKHQNVDKVDHRGGYADRAIQDNAQDSETQSYSRQMKQQWDKLFRQKGSTS